MTHGINLVFVLAVRVEADEVYLHFTLAVSAANDAIDHRFAGVGWHS